MQWSDNERKREKLSQETKGLWNASNSLSWEKQQTFRDPTTSFPAEWRLRNKCRNSMLMTCHWPDLGRVSDWTCCARNLLQPIRNTTQIWVVTRHQYGISALVSQTSFHGETSGGVAKYQLFSQVSFIHHTKNSPRVMKTRLWSDIHNKL